MSEERDERALNAALESLESLDPSGQPDRALDAEAREYLEIMGLLPYALEEEAVRPSLKDEILAQVGGVAVTPSQEMEERSVAQNQPAEGRTLDASNRFQSAYEPAPVSKGGPLTWALAAMLGVCLLGLTFLFGRVQEQTALIAELQHESEHHGASANLAPGTPMHDQFEMIRTIAPQVYPLQPSLNQPAPVNARGMIYVCPNHQRWYLSVKGLPPSPEGQEYRFWFMTEDGAVSAGPLNVESEAPIVLEASSMPEGTEGFTLTLEPKEGSGSMLQDRVVLKADEAISL